MGALRRRAWRSWSSERAPPGGAAAAARPRHGQSRKDDCTVAATSLGALGCAGRAGASGPELGRGPSADPGRRGTIAGHVTEVRRPAMTELILPADAARHRARARPSTTPRLVRREDETESLGLLLGPLRRRADAVRDRPVHDDRGHGRRPDRPAAVLGRLAAGGRRHRRLRVLRPARPGRHVHAAAVAAAGRPRDADDRPEGQVHAPARRRADPHLHLVGNGQRAVRLDDAAAPHRRAAAAGRLPQRRLVRRRARLPLDPRGLGGGRASYPVTYIPTVSRPNDPRNAGWMGRTGRVETILAPVLDELGLSPAELDRLHLRQPGHDPRRRGDAARPRLSRGPGPQGAVLAEGQGAARRGRAPTSPRPSTPPRRTRTSSGEVSSGSLALPGHPHRPRTARDRRCGRIGPLPPFVLQVGL